MNSQCHNSCEKTRKVNEEKRELNNWPANKEEMKPYRYINKNKIKQLQRSTNSQQVRETSHNKCKKKRE